ncbi:dUTP diphosphatase [Clostridium estertheticum]|uniref:dUTP diphosphatase n=1 Tax=Clostridium estertheticum TaxID=238834 RepID=UPI001C7D187D|nr:dUTP diphosphatase [Clostridium estertheticum]MBX4263753.1 dUTP diphosphatase [Clostridium estertheticum]MBX4269093.1 dUTP diphosphatase [Clostridium estertheticum]MCB2359112.1 dUTP diphosphatase [Clostridium estertheticum]WLC80503.1 dUTP diphosphatase [Clostridium estertheticum]WLC87567.1 dUTP diphosphatase [Clostridium estertheticum]
MMELKIKRINQEAKLPQYAHESDSGMDLFSVEEKIIEVGQTVLIKTGIILELPANTEAQIRPRSGLALKNSITVLNSPGTIDEGYRGEIGVILINHGKVPFKVEKEMKIAQMVINSVLKVLVKEIGEVTLSDRNSDGFGSTGLK